MPVVTIYRTNANDLISDYRVYTDIAPVFAGLPEAAAPAGQLTTARRLPR